MSVSADFLSRFCQQVPAPVVYTKQDVIDDFCAYIQKCATESHTSDIYVYITYMMPDKFKKNFTKFDFFVILQNVLINQMKCTLHSSPVCFQYEMEDMKSKSFYFVKTKISYQYNEEYKHQEFCNFNKFNEIPDGVFLKLYYRKN